MAGRTLIALLAIGGSSGGIFASAAPQPEKPVTLLRDVPVTSTLLPGDPRCPDPESTCFAVFTTQTSVTTFTNLIPGPSSSTVASQTSEPSVMTTSDSLSTTSIPVSTAFVTPLQSSETSQTSSSLSVSTSVPSSSASSLSDSPVASSPPPLSTGGTTQLTSDVPVVLPSVLPPFANSTSSTWSISSVLTSSGLLPTTSSGQTSRLTSDVPNVPSVPLTTSESASVTQSTSELPTSEVPSSSKITSTSKTIGGATSSAVTSDNTPPLATSSGPKPEDTSRSVVVSTHFHTETLTTKTTTTDTEYPPVTSVIDITTKITRTEVSTTTTTDQALVLPSCGRGGEAADGQGYYSVCPSTLETVTTPIVPPSSSSTSVIVDPLETFTTCTDETSKTKPTQHVTTGPSMTSVPSVPHPESTCHHANHDTHCYSMPIVATNSSTLLSTLSFSSSEPKTTAAGLGFTTICDSPHYASKDTTICSVVPVTSSTKPFIPDDNTSVPPEEHSEYSKTHHPTSTFLETSATAFTKSTSSVTRHEV